MVIYLSIASVVFCVATRPSCPEPRPNTTAWVDSKQLGFKDLNSVAIQVGDGDSDVQSVDSGADSDEDAGGAVGLACI